MRSLETLEEFKDAVGSERLSVIDFWAGFCQPCKAIAPYYAALAEEFPLVDFYKVDVEGSTANAIAQSERVRAMPTFLFYKGGVRLDEVVGADKARLRAAVLRLQ